MRPVRRADAQPARPVLLPLRRVPRRQVRLVPPRLEVQCGHDGRRGCIAGALTKSSLEGKSVGVEARLFFT